MDCRTARLLLNFTRPHATELEAAEASALEGHLAGCPACEALARHDEQFDCTLGRAVRDVPIPDGLRARILNKVHAERDARLRRRILVGAGLAATLLLCAYVGWIWLRPHPVPVNVAEVVQRANEGLNADDETRRRNVEAYFRAEGIDTVAPAQFDYGLLAWYEVVEFRHQRVPQLVFTRGQEHARVYILSGRQFDLGSLEEKPEQSQGGRIRAQVLLDNPSHPRFAYLVLYTGEHFEDFFRPPPSGGV